MSSIYPESLAEYLCLHAELSPERLAGASPDGRLEYGPLETEVHRLASFLIGIGVKPREYVAVLTPSRLDAYVLFLAVNAVGAVWLGLNPRYRLPEIQHVVRDARPRFLISMSQFRGRDYGPDIEQLLATTDCVEHIYCLDAATSFAKSLPDAIRNVRPSGSLADILVGRERRGELPAILVYTSGTSGRPKGALISNRSMIRRTRTQIHQWPTKTFPRVYNSYPMNHIGGLHWITSHGLVAGGTVHFRDQFEAEEISDLVAEEGINFLHFLPTMYKLLFSARSFSPEKFRSIEWHLFSGAAMPIELLRVLEPMAGRIGTSFGMTETCGSVAYAAPGTPIDVLAITIGKPTPAGEVRIVDAEERPVEKIG